MEFRVLGPLEVWANGKALSLGTRKQRTVLALLAVNANRLVSLDELVDELWPETPPASAVANVRSYAANLRRLMESAENAVVRLVRRNASYVLQAHPEELDLLVFRSQRKDGRDALRSGDAAAAAKSFAAARARWRGAMVADLQRGPMLAARCAVLEDEYLGATEDLAEAHLALSEPGEATELLREHVLAHPLREGAQALLMRALDRAGDSAGALSVFAAVRAALVDQLGIEPGPELHNLHQAILNRDPANVAAAPNAVLGAASQTVIVRPRELPPDIGYFVGRTSEAASAGAALIFLGRMRSPTTECRCAVRSRRRG